MKKCTLYNYILEDDATPTGGTAYEEETLKDFCYEADLHQELMQGNLTVINKALKECGIKPIKKSRLLNGWQVAVDIASCEKENKSVLQSPVFKTEKGATAWFNKLDFDCSDFDSIDVIMLQWNNGDLKDTYLLN